MDPVAAPFLPPSSSGGRHAGNFRHTATNWQCRATPRPGHRIRALRAGKMPHTCAMLLPLASFKPPQREILPSSTRWQVAISACCYHSIPDTSRQGGIWVDSSRASGISAKDGATKGEPEPELVDGHGVFVPHYALFPLSVPSLTRLWGHGAEIQQKRGPAQLWSHHGQWSSPKVVLVFLLRQCEIISMAFFWIQSHPSTAPVLYCTFVRVPKLPRLWQFTWMVLVASGTHHTEQQTNRANHRVISSLSPSLPSFFL